MEKKIFDDKTRNVPLSLIPRMKNKKKKKVTTKIYVFFISGFSTQEVQDEVKKKLNNYKRSFNLEGDSGYLGS